MEVLSIKQFCTLQGFVELAPSVRTNLNGYPFITFINADNIAENVYFSKALSLVVTKGLAINRELLANYQIGMGVNAKGEPRTKIIGMGDRISVADLF